METDYIIVVTLGSLFTISILVLSCKWAYIFYKRLRLFKVSLDILCALISNPERYKYISGLVDSGRISHTEANYKNINKARKIAQDFIDSFDNNSKK